MGVINRDGRYLARYRDEHGKKCECSFGRGEEARIAAEKYCREWEIYHQQMQEYAVQQDNAKSNNVVTLKMLVDEYLQQAHINGRSDGHLRSIMTVADAIFFPQLGADTPLTEIDYAKHILPFMLWLKTTPMANGKQRSIRTTNNYGNYLKTFFNYAVKRGYLDKNPMALWKKQYEPRKPRLLDRETIEAIMAHAKPHVAWAIEVAYNTGARTGESELLSLKWEDVDYEQGLIHIFGRKTKTHRWVPLSEEFLARLKAKQAESDCEYIISFRGKQVKAIRKAFRVACENAGVKYHVRMYDIRHRFASELFNANVPEGVVSKAIGHSRVSTTTDVYLEVLPKEIFNIRGKLPALRLPEAEKAQEKEGKAGTE